MAVREEDWYRSWFDSGYYHLLYSHRDEVEAEGFIRNLSSYLNLRPGARILDMPCGNGRHAQILSRSGYHVTGADLSPSNIRAAKALETENLQFIIHDMRNPLGEEEFDCVLNLFTSLGYFDDQEENLRTFRSLSASARPEGKIVIDFMNTGKVISELVPEEKKEVSGVEFLIRRYVKDGSVCKEIRVNDAGRIFHFMEKVKAWDKEDFQNYFNLAGLEQKTILGNYQLEDFDPESSPRMIFILSRR